MWEAVLSGGVWDGSRVVIASNATTTGGTWTQTSPGVWQPQGGTAAAGSVREIDRATGNVMSRSGQPFEIALPSNVLGRAQ